MAHSLTRQALEGSIKKWQDIVEGTGVDEGTYNCPLCHMYFAKGCWGCPVMNKTGKPGCYGTPYQDYTLYVDGAEKREVAFLISLREDVK